MKEEEEKGYLDSLGRFASNTVSDLGQALTTPPSFSGAGEAALTSTAPEAAPEDQAPLASIAPLESTAPQEPLASIAPLESTAPQEPLASIAPLESTAPSVAPSVSTGKTSRDLIAHYRKPLAERSQPLTTGPLGQEFAAIKSRGNTLPDQLEQLPDGEQFATAADAQQFDAKSQALKDQIDPISKVLLDQEKAFAQQAAEQAAAKSAAKAERERLLAEQKAIANEQFNPYDGATGGTFAGKLLITLAAGMAGFAGNDQALSTIAQNADRYAKERAASKQQRIGLLGDQVNQLPTEDAFRLQALAMADKTIANRMHQANLSAQQAQGLSQLADGIRAQRAEIEQRQASAAIAAEERAYKNALTQSQISKNLAQTQQALRAGQPKATSQFVEAGLSKADLEALGSAGNIKVEDARTVTHLAAENAELKRLQSLTEALAAAPQNKGEQFDQWLGVNASRFGFNATESGNDPKQFQRQALASLKTQALGQLSGAAVSDGEYKRFVEAFGESPAQSLNYVRNRQASIRSKVKRALESQGYGAAYNRLFGDNAPKQPLGKLPGRQ